MNLGNFMDVCDSKNMQGIDEEYLRMHEMYEKKFGCIVPREMLPPSVSVDDIKHAMVECIKSGDGNILGILGVEINSEYLY